MISKWTDPNTVDGPDSETYEYEVETKSGLWAPKNVFTSPHFGPDVRVEYLPPDEGITLYPYRAVWESDMDAYGPIPGAMIAWGDTAENALAELEMMTIRRGG